MRGFAGSRLRYPAGVVVRVRGVRATLSGWCGGAGARGLGNVIWLVWSISWLVGAGAREPAGSRLRYPARGWCGCAGLRVLGCVIRLVWLIGFSGFRHFIWLVWSISWRVGAGVQTRKPVGICRLRYLVGVVVRVFCCACWLVLCGWAYVAICGHVLLHHHASLRDGFFSCENCILCIFL